MNLLLLRPEDRCSAEAEGLFRLEGRRAIHIFSVLHGKEGDTLKAALPGGRIGQAVIVRSSKQEVLVRCCRFDVPVPEKNHIVPIISLPRPQSFKKTLHFIASSGIGKAFFVGGAKVEKSYWKSSCMAQQAIQEEIDLGMEQGMDPIAPQICFYPRLRDFFEQEKAFLASCERKIIAHPYNEVKSCPHALELQKDLALAVGPEGGYTNEEVEAFRQRGFECVTLGAHILRVEFALSVLCGKLIP